MIGLTLQINEKSKHTSDLGWKTIKILERILAYTDNINPHDDTKRTVYHYELVCLVDEKEIVTISARDLEEEICCGIYTI